VLERFADRVAVAHSAATLITCASRQATLCGWLDLNQGQPLLSGAGLKLPLSVQPLADVT
jgi:hypothetical protein